MTRDKSLALAFGVLAVLAIVGIGARILVGPGPNVVTVAAQAEQDGDQSTTITFLGDTLLGDQAQRILEKKGYDWPFAEVSDAARLPTTSSPTPRPPSPGSTEWGNPTADYSYRLAAASG